MATGGLFVNAGKYNMIISSFIVQAHEFSDGRVCCAIVSNFEAPAAALFGSPAPAPAFGAKPAGGGLFGSAPGEKLFLFLKILLPLEFRLSDWVDLGLLHSQVSRVSWIVYASQSAKFLFKLLIFLLFVYSIGDEYSWSPSLADQNHRSSLFEGVSEGWCGHNA